LIFKKIFQRATWPSSQKAIPFQHQFLPCKIDFPMSSVHSPVSGKEEERKKERKNHLLLHDFLVVHCLANINIGSIRDA